MTDLSQSAKQLDGPNRQQQEGVTLMLEDFRVAGEKRLHKTERADRPSIMVAPDKNKEA